VARFLLADADEARLVALAADVREEGLDAVVAGTGRDALEKAHQLRPQVILVGTRVGDMAGAELCRQLRQTPAVRHAYLITLAGADEEGPLADCLDAGADCCCVRPWGRGVLAARLRAGLRAAEARRSLERENEELRDVAARLADANRRFEKSAFTDALTGLPNRAFARDALAGAWEQSGQPLTCMMLDIDHFKRVNDTHGHDVGDLILQRTGEAMRASVRASDTVCRLGGEEFLLICRGTSAVEGLAAAERIRGVVERNKVSAPGFAGGVTISIGVAERVAGMGHPDELLKEADLAVYAAKHGGRYRVCVAGGHGGAAPPVSPSASAPTANGARMRVRA
jgi:diguanylate cyclase (GGDEF)-like protein